MNINRNNYEEFFILYLDNELASEDRLRVETFVQENPDLQAEFSMLNQLRFSPDDNISFEHKDSLLQAEDPAVSDLQESVLLYLDNELDSDSRDEFETALGRNPEMQAELDLYRKASFNPNERIVFPYKETLYRREEKARIVPIGWRRIAAAAAILLAVSVTTFVVMNRKKDAGQDIAGYVQSAVQEGKGTASTAPDTRPTGSSIASVDSAAGIEKQDAPVQPGIVAGNTEKFVKPVTAPVKKVLPENETGEEKMVKVHNNLPKPVNNPYAGNTEDKPQLVSNDVKPRQALTQPEQKNTLRAVTPGNDEALQLAVNRSADPGDDDFPDQPSRKNKLRGFFRKVTRTFEKNTNIKATDEDDRLLVGGLAIRL